MRESNPKRRNYNFDNNGETIAWRPSVKQPRQYWRNARSQSHSDLAGRGLGQSAFTEGLPSKYKEILGSYNVLTFFTGFLRRSPVQKSFLELFEQCTCLFAKSLLESLSILTECLTPKTRRVWINGATRGPLDESVGSLNRRVGRSPKRPTNALFERVLALLI